MAPANGRLRRAQSSAAQRRAPASCAVAHDWETMHAAARIERGSQLRQARVDGVPPRKRPKDLGRTTTHELGAGARRAIERGRGSNDCARGRETRSVARSNRQALLEISRGYRRSRHGIIKLQADWDRERAEKSRGVAIGSENASGVAIATISQCLSYRAPPRSAVALPRRLHSSRSTAPRDRRSAKTRSQCYPQTPGPKPCPPAASDRMEP